MNKIDLLPINSEAKRWRDLDASDIRKEKCLKIGLAAIGLLLLGGLCVGSYHYLQAIAHLSFLGPTPAIYLSGGGILAGSFFIASYVVDVEKFRNGWYQFEPNFEKEPEKALRHYKRLTSKPLDVIYNKYHCRHGGIRPLVRGGLLTVQEGNRLSSLLKEYARDVDISQFGDDRAKRKVNSERENRKTHQQLQESWSRKQLKIANWNPVAVE